MNKHIVVGSIAILILIGSGLWFGWKAAFYGTPEKPGRSGNVNNESSPKDHDRRGSVNESVQHGKECVDQPRVPIRDLNEQQLAERYYGLRGSDGTIAHERALAGLEKGEVYYHNLYDRKTKTYIQGGIGIPLDTPKVELRFRKPGKDGKLVPVRIGYMRCYRIANGRTYSVRKGEQPGLDCGLSRDFDYAHNARFLLAEDLDSLPYAVYLFGHKYYMEFYSYRNRTDPLGTAVIQIPEEVPPGKMAVVTVDVTKKAQGWGDPSMYNRPEKKTVIFRLPEGMDPGRIAGALYDPGRRGERPIKFDNAGTAEVEVYELGGEMFIGRGGEKDGHVLYYKRNVESTDIQLPDDADLAVAPANVISFRVEVPQEKVPYDELGLGLLVHRDSKFPVAGMQFASVDGWDRSSKKPPKTVPMNAPPGQYYVAYGRDPEVIGKITIKESDAGKTLEVQPLEE